MKNLEKHTKNVLLLASKLDEMPSKEAIDAAWLYIRTLRRSKLSYDTREELRTRLRYAIERAERSLRPITGVLQGEALVSRPSRAKLTLIIGGAA